MGEISDNSPLTELQKEKYRLVCEGRQETFLYTCWKDAKHLYDTRTRQFEAKKLDLLKRKKQLDNAKKKLLVATVQLEELKDKLKLTLHSLQETKSKLQETKDQLQETKTQLQKQKSKYLVMKNSLSFRIGRAVTWLPRKVQILIRRFT